MILILDLPYWDWGADGKLSPEQLTAQIWTDNCMGGSGCQVTTGPFAEGSWRVNIEQGFAPGSFTPVLVSTNRGVLNLPWADVNILSTKSEVRSIVNLDETNIAYDRFPWDRNSDGFQNGLEGWFNGPTMHNRVHVWVAETWGPSTSLNDLVFYLNHCNVDRIWAEWREIHENPPYLPEAQASTRIRGHRLYDRLFRITTSELFDPVYRGGVSLRYLLEISARYTYDTFNE